MANNQSNADVPTLISIQVNGNKTARVRSNLSITVADFRASLLAQGVQLPENAQFLDAQGYPVSSINEQSLNIRDVLVSTGDGQTIMLRIREPAANVVPQRSTIMNKTWFIILFIAIPLFAYYLGSSGNRKSIMCPVLVRMNSNSLVEKFSCNPDPNPPDNDTYTDTADYLKEKIMTGSNGTEILISTKKGLEKVDSKDNGYFVSVYEDWVQNETTYKADYEWYNGMVANWGHCPGRFDEKIINSDNIILDTLESIQEFTSDEFQEWPQKIRVKLNIKNRVNGSVNDDGDEFSQDENGKIASNMYLAAWRRPLNGTTVHIQTYATIFERTAGQNCHFNPHYWSGHRDRITNAKKYYLLTKVKSNPAFRNFLTSIPRA
jgi:hypothetical protein